MTDRLSARLTPTAFILFSLGVTVAAVPPAQAFGEVAGQEGGGRGGIERAAYGGGGGGGLENMGIGAKNAAGSGSLGLSVTPGELVKEIHGPITGGDGSAGYGVGQPGGDGGAGIFSNEQNDIHLTVFENSTIRGGSGGIGGHYYYDPMDGFYLPPGAGGGGGSAIAIKTGNLTLLGRVLGGNGGSGGVYGGNGGDAVVLTSGQITVGAQAQIVGGNGGDAYLPMDPFSLGPTYAGSGGNGISIGSGSVVNHGSVQGGAAGAALLAGDNTVVINKGIFASADNAVVFQGKNNSLTLWQDSTTTGNVIFQGSQNTLALDNDAGPARVTIGGNLDFGTRGIYAVRATPVAADSLVVTGEAKLNDAIVTVTAAPGAYAANTRYNILQASGFRGTRFGSVTADLAYLTPSLSYSADSKTAYLTLSLKQAPVQADPDGNIQGGSPSTRPIRFADLVAGKNAIATANAVNSMPASDEVYRYALTLPNDAPQSFFSTLSGEAHASAASALQGLSGQARSVPLTQLRANLGAGLRPGVPTAAAGISDAAPASATLPTSNARPAWAQLVGNWQRLGGTNDTVAARLHTGGVFAGADGATGSGWRLGGALGYTDSNLRTDGVDAKTDISSYSAIVYGGKAFDAGPGKLNLMLGAAYTWHDISTQRRIAVGGLDQTLRADYGASTTQVFTELGWALPIGNALTVEPYAGLAWAGQRSRGFQESGGSAALSGSSQTDNATTTTLGVRARQTLTLGTFQGTLTGGAGWRHAFGDLRPTSKLAFDAGDAFTVAGAPIARNAALLEAGLDATVRRNATIGLGYAGQFGSGNQDHSVTLAWRWAF